VVSGDPTQVPLAGPANRQGRMAADHIFGRDARSRGTQGTAIVRVFERTAALTGASEKVLKRSNRPYRQVYVHPTHHAGYYPGAEAMTLRLLFDTTTGRVLGAQAVGGAGVDKRTDVLAVAIQAGMTVFDLEEMELAYSPQYGSAKDPINMAGFVAGGLLRGDHPQVDVETVLPSPAGKSPFLLDVRTPQELEGGHIPGAVNIPVDDLRSRLAELPHDRESEATWRPAFCGRLGLMRRTSAAGTRRFNSGVRMRMDFPSSLGKREAVVRLPTWDESRLMIQAND